MSTISVEEIENNPLGFLRRIEAGEALLVVQGERLLAQVQPLPTASADVRPYGLCAGQFTLPATFDEALPDDVIAEFEKA